MDGGILWAAGGTTLAIVILLCRLDILKIAGYHAPIDVGISLGLAIFMGGSYAGILVAVFTGVALSAMFEVIRFLFGYKKLVRGRWVYVPTATR